jgi:anti-sigma regulatory factor (Ser/Thr protein kinase)
VETTHLSAWLGAAETLSIIDDASISVAREHVRALASQLGFADEVIAIVATAATELARNQLVHARDGRFAVRSIERRGVRGLELVAGDRGPGLADPTLALGGAISTSGGLGSGLASVRRLMDEVDFDVRLGAGTCIWARKFIAPVAYRSEVAILGRPCEGELESGDDSAFVRHGDGLTIGVIDGLGHGILARDVAVVAAEVFRSRAELDPATLLHAVDDRLQGTRGAVMAVARIDRTLQVIEHAGCGDVRTSIYRPRDGRRLLQVAGVLGGAGQRGREYIVQREPLHADDVIVMFSDGLTKGVDISEELQLLRRHPIVIAAYLLERFGRVNDDVMVLVTR